MKKRRRRTGLTKAKRRAIEEAVRRRSPFRRAEEAVLSMFPQFIHTPEGILDVRYIATSAWYYGDPGDEDKEGGEP